MGMDGGRVCYYDAAKLRGALYIARPNDDGVLSRRNFFRCCCEFSFFFCSLHARRSKILFAIAARSRLLPLAFYVFHGCRFHGIRGSFATFHQTRMNLKIKVVAAFCRLVLNGLVS